MSSDPLQILITMPFTEQQVDMIRAVSPLLKVTAIRAHQPNEIPGELWAKTDILYTDTVLPDPSIAPNLKWIQFHYTGIDYALNNSLLKKPDLMITNMSGANAPQVAEYALTLMLALSTNLKAMVENQLKSAWPAKRWENFRQHELRGSTVGLVGYGSIAREIARLLVPFGAIILAAKRDLRQLKDEGYFPAGLGDPDGDLFTRLYPIEALKSMLKECDYVVLALPYTPTTRNLFSTEEFGSMKPSALFIDLSRGGIVDLTAMKEALEKKVIAGAAIDVFPEEPLPANSPLWKLPNTIISPHVGGVSTQYNNRAAELFCANIRRYLQKAALLNRFDPEKGY
ncbi:MAG: D-2-hydroxyacid dehydrogenase [Leptolinea sp.]